MIRLYYRNCPFVYHGHWDLSGSTYMYVLIQQILANILFFWKSKTDGTFIFLFNNHIIFRP